MLAFVWCSNKNLTKADDRFVSKIGYRLLTKIILLRKKTILHKLFIHKVDTDDHKKKNKTTNIENNGEDQTEKFPPDIAH